MGANHAAFGGVKRSDKNWEKFIHEAKLFPKLRSNGSLATLTMQIYKVIQEARKIT